MRQERGRIRYTFFQRGLPVTGRHEWAQAKVPSLHYSITLRYTFLAGSGQALAWSLYGGWAGSWRWRLAKKGVTLT